MSQNNIDLTAFGYQEGQDVEEFLTAFGYDKEVHEIHSFCLSTWNLDLSAKPESTIDPNLHEQSK